MKSTNLVEILDSVWDSLAEGVEKGKSAYHLGQVATSEDSMVRNRTVVLRGAERSSAQVWFHTDARSPKFKNLNQNSTIAWVFYDRESRVQLRISGAASKHHMDARCKGAWEKTSLMSRRCYLVEKPPGSPLKSPDSALPENLKEREPDANESEAGYKNFALVTCHVEEIDWLLLRARGHMRAHYVLSAKKLSAKKERESQEISELWSGTWVVP